MKEEFTETSAQTSWNLSEWKTNLIGGELKKAVDYLSRGQYVNFFNCWKNIRMVIDNRLKDKELRQAKKWEREISKKGRWERNHMMVKYITTPNYVFAVEQYAQLINKYLKRIGMDIKERGESSLF